MTFEYMKLHLKLVILYFGLPQKFTLRTFDIDDEVRLLRVGLEENTIFSSHRPIGSLLENQ